MTSFAWFVSLLAVSWARECDHCSCFLRDATTMLLDCSGDHLDFPKETIVMSDAVLSLPADVSLEADFSNRGMTVLRSVVLKNLTSLDLADNELGDNRINVRAFEGVAATLRHLSLARNHFVTFNAKVFQPLQSLESLDLSGNKVVDLPDDAFPALPSLLVLDLFENQLGDIGDNVLVSSFPALQKLDLSGNALKSLWSSKFLSQGIEIRELSLARNKLIAEDLKELRRLAKLERLDVSRNEIKEFPAQVELHSVVEVNVGHCGINALNSLLKAFPKVTKVSAPANVIIELDALASSHVKFLDVSDNAIFTLPMVGVFGSLEFLDLSGNSIKTIPANLRGLSYPSLKTLLLDRNPLVDVNFGGAAQFPRLRNLSITNVETLTSINAEAFTGLLLEPEGDVGGDAATESCPDGQLQILAIANNKNLESIDKDAFRGVKMCKIDLSGNALQEISQTLIDWKNTPSVDLQNNPWNCQCSLNWILDEVMKPMYESDQPQLLYELRCNNPSYLRDARMVRFYNKEQKQANDFCVKHSGMMIIKSTEFNTVPDDGLAMAGSTIAAVVVVSLTALLLILVVVGVLLQRRGQKLMRIRNRRFKVLFKSR